MRRLMILKYELVIQARLLMILEYKVVVQCPSPPAYDWSRPQSPTQGSLDSACCLARIHRISITKPSVSEQTKTGFLHLQKIDIFPNISDLYLSLCILCFQEITAHLW